ncbi:MAG: hypothetical protein EOO05_16185, partial [Chitinophagaceae bacterium]
MFAKMITDETRAGLQDLIRGNGTQGSGDRFTAISGLLRESFGPGRTSQKEFESKSVIKENQQGFLKEYAQANNLWI